MVQNGKTRIYLYKETPHTRASLSDFLGRAYTYYRLCIYIHKLFHRRPTRPAVFRNVHTSRVLRWRRPYNNNNNKKIGICEICEICEISRDECGKKGRGIATRIAAPMAPIKAALRTSYYTYIYIDACDTISNVIYIGTGYEYARRREKLATQSHIHAAFGKMPGTKFTPKRNACKIYMIEYYCI